MITDGDKSAPSSYFESFLPPITELAMFSNFNAFYAWGFPLLCARSVFDHRRPKCTTCLLYNWYYNSKCIGYVIKTIKLLKMFLVVLQCRSCGFLQYWWLCGMLTSLLTINNKKAGNTRSIPPTFRWPIRTATSSERNRFSNSKQWKQTHVFSRGFSSFL